MCNGEYLIADFARQLERALKVATDALEEIRKMSAIIGYDGGHAGICYVSETAMAKIQELTK